MSPDNYPQGNPPNPHHSLPVLIVDDNTVDQQLTALYLSEAWPFERDLALEYANNGAAALAKLASSRFALVVLDWTMPVLGGNEVLRQLRAQGSHVPVIVLSGLERQAIPEDLEQLGAAFLSKDGLTADGLHAAIATSLRLLGFPLPASK